MTKDTRHKQKPMRHLGANLYDNKGENPDFGSFFRDYDVEGSGDKTWLNRLLREYRLEEDK